MEIDEEGYKKCWHIVNDPYHEFDLHDNSIFVLHPNDEKPMIRHSGEYLSQFQHGKVLVKEGLLSIGLIFRHVTNSLRYDNVTGTRVLPKNFFNGKTEYLEKFDATLENFTTQKTNIPHQFKHQATQKCKEWDWI